MKWKVRIITKRKRKQAMRVKANTIEELVEKLSRHAGKIQDFEIETSLNDPAYWKTLILAKLFEKTHTEDSTPLLF
jgi:thioredoxin reductase